MKRYVVECTDGNIEYCSVTKRAAQNHADKRKAYFDHYCGSNHHETFTVRPYNIDGVCPVHRVEHK